jgi:hypothetical protein
MRRTIVAAIAAIGMSTSCGPVGPGPVQGADTSSEPPSDAVASDTAVAASIVDQIRSLGLEARIAERMSGQPFSVAMQRVAFASDPDRVYLLVYPTAELAADEASRITWDGQLIPVGGPTRMVVDYVERQSFYYRDRVIARQSGCGDRVTNVMERLLGLPVVVTTHLCSDIR